MTKPITALPPQNQQEVEMIRKILADRSRIQQAFPAGLEQAFWQSLADRATQMIRDVATLGVLIYILFGLIRFPSIYFVASEASRFHDTLIWLVVYLNGGFCLVLFPIIASIPRLSAYFQRTILLLSFFAIFVTTLLTMQYQEPSLVQNGSYIIIFVYMLIYFLSGVRPKILLLTCFFAGVLPLPILWYLGVQVDALSYFYAVIFSNFIGFFISQSIINKERAGFLQGRVLELDKLQAKALSERLAKLSNEDSLTGLYNRRYFNQAIHDEWERAARSGESLSLVFIDIDYFKKYNDNYGHLKGDDAIVEVTKVLQDHIRRTSDMASRYGGEEFILLLPNTPSSGAQVVANNIMIAMDALQIEHKTSTVKPYLTLSIGIATWSGEQNMTEATLISQADQAVYQAKNEGRHLIRLFNAVQ